MRLLVLLFGVSLALAGFSRDIKGSKDHPSIKRYKGSSITGYSYKKFDEYKLINKKITQSPDYGGKIDRSNSIPLEGALTMIAYKVPSGRSTLEVSRNYENALKGAGFEILYKCSHKDCGGRDFHQAMKVSDHGAFAEKYRDQRYLAVKYRSNKGETYASVYIVGAYSGDTAKENIRVQLNVVDIVSMEKNMVKVDADAMFKSIAAKGKIALYGIYFDYDKAVVKPESKPALEQIAKLLKQQVSLKLVIVGHSDNKGTLKYNMSLSHRRADAVVNALVSQYGIDRSRLKSWGIGFLAPVASNRTEQGRALNRRVELVEQ